MQEAAKAAKEYAPLKKERLQEEETAAKQERAGLSEKEIEAHREAHYEKFVNVASGEISYLPKKKKNDRHTKRTHKWHCKCPTEKPLQGAKKAS